MTAVNYPTGDDVSYTYDANGNIATMTVGANTTTYTYDNADQMTSDGTTTFEYDENGNLVEAGSDTYDYEYRNMMASATVDSVTTDYTYDGDGVRASKENTEYVYDRAFGLPVLVDDGTNAYLHHDGVLGAIDGGDGASYLLSDALGSVRVVTDDAGDLVGSADYNVYGEIRGSTGLSTLFRYTGEQYDAETGFTYLRSRYLHPELARFTSVDTVQPNAAGTQGYNQYAYVAGNPTTWVDPSGHSVRLTDTGLRAAAILSHVMANPYFLGTVAASCALGAVALAGPTLVLAGGWGVVAGGVSAGGCIVYSVLMMGALSLACALTDVCRTAAFEQAGIQTALSSTGPVGKEGENEVPGIEPDVDLPDIDVGGGESFDPWERRVSETAREHILYGEKDEFGRVITGGHLFGWGLSEDTEFPEGMTEPEIINAIEEIANDSDIAEEGQGALGRIVKRGWVHGLEIEVIIEAPPSTDIVTGYPVNVPPVP